MNKRMEKMFIVLEDIQNKNNYFTTGFGSNNEPTQITKFKTYKEAEKFISERFSDPHWQNVTFVVFEETCKLKANVNIELVKIENK
jgi:hypothetical protein